jgi:hypothetical protein
MVRVLSRPQFWERRYVHLNINFANRLNVTSAPVFAAGLAKATFALIGRHSG